jgi:hypothetical protein
MRLTPTIRVKGVAMPNRRAAVARIPRRMIRAKRVRVIPPPPRAWKSSKEAAQPASVDHPPLRSFLVLLWWW